MREIAVVGGGPAGAMCGERLARSGYSVTIYDEHLAWEKPCGGGLTHKAIKAYPFLLDGPYPKKLIRTVELISSKGHRAVVARSSYRDLFEDGAERIASGTSRSGRLPRCAFARESD